MLLCNCNSYVIYKVYMCRFTFLWESRTVVRHAPNQSQVKAENLKGKGYYPKLEPNATWHATRKYFVTSHGVTAVGRATQCI